MSGPSVGIGHLVASADPGTVITALGLGSCIGLVFADARVHVAGMAHVMLPESRAGAAGGLPGKFADTAVPALLDEVLRLGADRSRLNVTMAGGAQMFAAGSGGSLMRIGERNAEAVRGAVQAVGMRVRSADVGGSLGRSMSVDVSTGVITVRAVGQQARTL